MFNKNRACQHLRLLGLKPTQASRFTSLVQKWHDKSGPEWTYSRLKSLESYLKQRKSGAIGVPIPKGWATKSSRSCKSRFQDDLLHELFSSSNYNFELALQFCRLSHGLILREKIVNEYGKSVFKDLPPSKSQLSKVLNAIEGPVEKPRDDAMMHMYDEFLGMDMLKYPDCRDLDVLPMIYWPRSNVSSPYLNDKGIISTARRGGKPECWSLDILYSDSEFANFTYENIGYVTNCVLGKGDHLLPRPNLESATMSLTGGAFAFNQELGCKIRPTVNPWLAIQAVLEPLKDALKRISLGIPEIVTYDQQVGRDQLHEWISSHKKVHSIDASSFTDRFPLDYQLEVLRRLVDADIVSNQMLEAFRIASTKPYYSNELKRNISYDAGGQGQGLGASFGMATLAHYELLESMRRYLELPKNQFKLVGDDVIIVNDELAQLYMIWMGACNVEINMEKSIVSNSLGEFAGASVTSEEVIMRPKLGVITRDDQVISLFDILKNKRGSNFIMKMEVEFEDQQRKMHVPDDFGGRRDSLYNSGIQVLPLNDFAVTRQRILKDIKDIVPYSSKAVERFLNDKEWKRDSILHTTISIDNPKLLRLFNYPREQRSGKRVFSAFEMKPINEYIDHIGKLQLDVRKCRTYKDLLAVTLRNGDVISLEGYLNTPLLHKSEGPIAECLIEKELYVPVEDSHRSQVSKLVDVDEISRADNPNQLARLIEKAPADNAWREFLQVCNSVDSWKTVKSTLKQQYAVKTKRNTL